MILVYALIVLILGASALFAGLRARWLERRFVHAAEAANKLAKELSYRGGNCNVPDPLKAARRQFELGRFVQVRDRLEEKYDAWEGRADACRRHKRALLTCKGRFLPYAFGVIDLLGVLAVLTLTNLIDPGHLQVAIQSARMLVLR